MKPSDRIRKEWIKPKVIFGFLIVFSIASAALFVTFKGFVDLTQSRQSFSEPSKKLISLNSILTDIYEAESNIRTYTLTQNESYLTLYLSFMGSINSKVDSLLTLVDDYPVQAEKIRFIQNLLTRKRRVLNELVALKRTDQTSSFYLQALEQVENIQIDSLKEAAVITSVTTTKTSRRDSVISKVLDESSQSSFSRFFRWFSRKEPTDSIISKLIVDIETQVDTLRRSVLSPSDSILNEVIKILTEIQTQQEMSLYNISAKELEILKSDKEIMDQIRTVVSLLEREELMNSIQLAEEVEATVRNSTILLLTMGGAAFLMVVFFTWLIFRDITKANFYRNKLLAAKQLAEKLLKVKEEFLANMNHEIRTPLSAIVGLSNQLKKTDLNPKQEFIAQSLSKSSQHLLDIVNDILDLTKIEGGFLRFESIPFNPSVIAKEAADTLLVKAQEKGIALKVEHNQGLGLWVKGDPFRLKQILLNLIGNAIKFTQSGTVTVRLTHQQVQDKISCQFQIIDTGIGIPNESIDAIFEQFSQVDASTTRLYGGTGLGLTIVKKLVELQGGSISVESEVSRGTTFTVNLDYPVAVDQEQESNTEHVAKAPQLPHDLSIVVVDDDPISQLLVSEMLKTLGVTPQVYSNPLDALKGIEQNCPTIVLTDIQMPQMSGIDLVKRIAEIDLSNAPFVVALTANSTANRKKYYSDAGFHSALTKPFNEFDLYNIIAPIVGHEAIKNTSLPSADRVEGYDISEIRRFAGDDDESTCEILQSFIDNYRANVKYLLMFVEQKNWKGVGEVAHKMKSAFRQLKVEGVAATLEELERIDPLKNDNARVESYVAEICSEVERVQTMLKRDIDRIRVKAG